MKRLLSILLLGLLWCVPGYAAVAYDSFISSCATSSGTSIGSCSLTIGGGVTNGAVMVGIIFDVSIGTPSSIGVTVGGNAATLLSGTSQTAGFSNTYIYCIATGSSTGSTAIASTWTGTSAAGLIAVSGSGVDQTTPCNGGVNFGVGFLGTPSLAITSAAGDLSVDFVGIATTGLPANTPTQTSIAQTNNTATGISSSRATTPAASVTHAWAAVNGWGSQSGANFKAAAAGGATPRTLTLLGVGD